MQFLNDNYNRLITREAKIGNLIIGNGSSIKIQTMTTTDTMDTAATVAQTIRCIEAGAQLVRITAPSINEANNLLNIKNELRKQGYNTPLVADIHFTPNAAEAAARIIEKVRVNPGNYVDKKKFQQIEYTDGEYIEEVERIHDRFMPLVNICKQYGTAMRIGTNHGSLSDRIMSRYGDTAIGMVESAMEFLRICRGASYHNIVLSMKSSNPQVMVHAYRLLVKNMLQEFNECYPLHLGVTEAGDGEEGRIKSAIGIGTLLEDGIGDTIRVSLTEDPEFEIPVCKDIVKKYNEVNAAQIAVNTEILDNVLNPFEYNKMNTIAIENIGAKHVPVVVADLQNCTSLTPEALQAVGYTYNADMDKWSISDTAADYIYTGDRVIQFALPGTVKTICNYSSWQLLENKKNTLCLVKLGTDKDVINNLKGSSYFLSINVTNENAAILQDSSYANAIFCLHSNAKNAFLEVRKFIIKLIELKITNPVVIMVSAIGNTIDEQLIQLATHAGALFLDGMGDGIWLSSNNTELQNLKTTGRTYIPIKNMHQFLNNTSFSILQATRTRISKTEYISCPSCGRTLFDLQETTAKVRAVTHHLKGVKIAIMGCIVNGPGEMADADYGYVGSGPGKITLYKGKEVMKKNLNSEVAVAELINIIKENGEWIEQQ